MKTTKGIDVSTWQDNIDFDKVKAAGYDFVIIRAGYGRSAKQKDNRFEQHYKNAKAAGMAVGAYWYSYADSVADAVREANACIECIRGKTFEFPVYFDMEENSQTKFGKATLTAMAKGFCEAIRSAGYKPGVYSNLNWFTNYLDYDELKKSYSIWFAQYHTEHQLDCDIWQNSSEGKVPGYSGNIDTNYCYVDFVKTTTAKEDSKTTTNKKPATSKAKFKKGDRVKVKKAVTYDGEPFGVFFTEYDVIEAKGDRVVIGIGNTVTAAVKDINLTAVKKTTTTKKPSKAIVEGGKVKVVKAVTYDGQRFKSYYSQYDVIEVKGDRVVIGVGKTVTAAVDIKNLKAV